MRILVVVAHPDDEVLGCGGTIARRVIEGDEIHCLFIGEGVTSRPGLSDEEKLEGINKLREQTAKAAAILGIKKIFFRSFPDNCFDSLPLLAIVRTIEAVKGEVNPEIIYTHHHGDLNIDHSMTFRAVLTACRPLQEETVKEIYSFEVLSSTEWNSPDSENCFMPNVFVDISQTIVRKVQALKIYEGEIREYPHPRSPEGIEVAARRWGMSVCKEFVEPFQLIRSIR